MKIITYSLILAATLSSFTLAQPHDYSHSSMQMQHDTQGISSNILQSMHKPMMENSAMKSGSADKDFLSNMIPHHQGAIAASEEILKVTNNTTIKKIANAIIQAQKQEIAEMENLLKGME